MKKIHPWLLATAITVHYALATAATWGLTRWNLSLPNWLETLYIGTLVVPVVMICRPWFPALSALGLMEGDMVRLPSVAGASLVVSGYVILLVATGFFLDRREKIRKRPAIPGQEGMMKKTPEADH